MLHIYKTVDDELLELEEFDEGIWVNLIAPDENELQKVSKSLKVDIDYLKAALDEEERARIENDNGQTLIIADIPVMDKEGNLNVYITIPLGIIIMKDAIITVCLRENNVLKDFISKKVKSFFTYYKTRFILQILYKNATQYLQYLRFIEKASSKIEQDLHKSMKNKELILLLKLEKSLIYFSTSLRANELVLEKMMKLEYVKKYPDDTDLLEDVITENKQAIEMASIYSDVLSGTMDAFASIISNNVNIVMKFLTSVTIILAIPTMVSSFFGMNVPVPFANTPFGFALVILIAIFISSISIIYLYKRKMF